MIYLASASPRRHELLSQAGIEHVVLLVPSPPGEDEPILPGESPDAYVQRTAYEKAWRALHWLGLDTKTLFTDASQANYEHSAIAQPDAQQSSANWPRSTQTLPFHPVLAADTTVILDGKVLGKPQDVTHAKHMLRCLSGTSHEVHTAIVLAVPGEDGESVTVLRDVSRTKVVFKALSDAEINAYCTTGEPMGKAGAYGIQGHAALFVECIHGSYTGVVGLPLYETGRLLQRAAIIA